jgi:hypothetical protein
MVLPTLACSPGDKTEALPPLPLDERTLAAVIEEIIPAGEGMPSASEAGVLHYFRQLAGQLPELPEALREALDAVEGSSQERFGGAFLDLSTPQRIDALERLEEEDPGVFGGLSVFVYEAYYVQPAVWELLGYEPYPTGEAGPSMEPFDEAALDRVRSAPALYRGVL